MEILTGGPWRAIEAGPIFPTESDQTSQESVMGLTKQETKTIWAVCPLEDCTYALEYEPDESYFCPLCELEMITRCSSCRAYITEEEPTLCESCGQPVKG